MYRHERSLVERYRDKPFVLLGVNSDPEIHQAQAAIERHGMNWRSWWDGSNGPIASHWQVGFYPMVYVLDEKGVIRFAQVRGPHLQQAIDFLLAEMEHPNDSQNPWLKFLSFPWRIDS